MRPVPMALATLSALATVVACGSRNPNSPSSQQVGANANFEAVFSVPPVDLSQVRTITPLGHIQPPGHVLPTDHVYFYQVDIDQPYQPAAAVLQVVAPASGIVDFMLTIPPINDVKIQFRVNQRFSYYLDHVFPIAGIKVGSEVLAGQAVGTTGPGASLDLGAYDRAVTLSGFISPGRYPDQTLHCVSPWQYFAEPIRSQIYSRVRRVPTAPDRDGRIDYDVPGRLVGSWFHESVTGIETSGPNGWPKSIAFAYDYKDPSLVRISIGGTMAAAGIWTIEPAAPRPESVSVSSGKVSYRLMYTESTTVQSGLMLVQMLDDLHLKIEVWEGSQADTAEFDSRALIYRR
jgi:hypothetical protein